MNRELEPLAKKGDWQSMLEVCRSAWRSNRPGGYDYYYDAHKAFLRHLEQDPSLIEKVELDFLIKSLFDEHVSPENDNYGSVRSKYNALHLKEGMDKRPDRYVLYDAEKLEPGEEQFTVDFPKDGHRYLHLREMRIELVKKKFESNGWKLDVNEPLPLNENGEQRQDLREPRELKQLGLILGGSIIGAINPMEGRERYSTDKDIYHDTKGAYICAKLLSARNEDGTPVNNIPSKFGDMAPFWRQMPFNSYKERKDIAYAFGKGLRDYAHLMIREENEARAAAAIQNNIADVVTEPVATPVQAPVVPQDAPVPVMDVVKDTVPMAAKDVVETPEIEQPPEPLQKTQLRQNKRTNKPETKTRTQKKASGIQKVAEAKETKQDVTNPEADVDVFFVANKKREDRKVKSKEYYKNNKEKIQKKTRHLSGGHYVDRGLHAAAMGVGIAAKGHIYTTKPGAKPF